MDTRPRLIYCGGGNKRFADIAIAEGFLYGSRLPDTVYHPLFFADQDFKQPDRAAYMRCLAIHKPVMATVIDWEYKFQLPAVLDWAEEVSQYTEYVVIIPKVVAGIPKIPRKINGKPVILGYSVPTRYGSTPCKPREFKGWGVHLLGGSPHRQMKEYDAMISAGASVFSADGNMAQKMATMNRVWQQDTPKHISPQLHWPSLEELDGGKWLIDAPYEAYRRSCVNIIEAWNNKNSPQKTSANP